MLGSSVAVSGSSVVVVPAGEVTVDMMGVVCGSGLVPDPGTRSDVVLVLLFESDGEGDVVLAELQSVVAHLIAIVPSH